MSAEERDETAQAQRATGNGRIAAGARHSHSPRPSRGRRPLEPTWWWPEVACRLPDGPIPGRPARGVRSMTPLSARRGGRLASGVRVECASDRGDSRGGAPSPGGSDRGRVSRAWIRASL